MAIVGARARLESFYNWPLLYLLGGDDELLTLGQRQFDATTKLGVELGHVYNEYEVGYDQFHQSESMIYFYLLCMADPTHPVNAERAQRFAGLFMNEDPEAHNYDPKHNILRSAHNGSKGARKTVWGAYGGPGFSSGSMARYGLPYEDVMGVDGRLITSIEDLEDPENARRMGETMQRRMGMGDTATNLHVCTMMQNAFIMSGNEKFKQWLLNYVTGWMERAEQQPHHLLPDNVSLTGVVGGEIGGKWYGSSYGAVSPIHTHNTLRMKRSASLIQAAQRAIMTFFCYGGIVCTGWSWPHGFYNIAMASLLAGVSCFQLTGDRKFLQLPRNQINAIMSLGKVEALDMSKMSLAEHWLPQMCAIAGHTIADAHGDAAITTGGSTLATRDRIAASAGDALATPTFVVPYRYIDSGWFDYQPMAPMSVEHTALHLACICNLLGTSDLFRGVYRYPMMLYNVCGEDEDMAILETIREKEGFDWAGVYSFRTKEDAGHEAPWLCYLKGENPSFPVQILQAAMAQVYRRSEQIRQDKTVGSDGRYDRSMPARGHDIHHWQVLNPVREKPARKCQLCQLRSELCAFAISIWQVTTEALIMLTLGAPQMLYK